jgi:PTH1 family peptidyl-tRNA hydrolase
MKIIVCLGNPGKQYSKNRHNAGFLIGGSFATYIGLDLNKKSFSSVSGTCKYEGNDLLMIFPQTYMNSSGVAVQQALSYYREVAENLIVIHDEIEMPAGNFDSKFAGGHRGHNGLRSIVEKTGSRDFYRVRYGVGRPENPNISVADFVLSNFTAEELDHMEGNMENIFDLIKELLKAERSIN